MIHGKIAFLFPGQGAYFAGALRGLKEACPGVAECLGEIDEVGRKRLGKSVAGVLDGSLTVEIETLLREDPDLLQLAIYAISIAAYQVLESQGVRPDVLAGHSFGEIAAMVAGGAFTLAQGAEIVCDRVEALATLAGSDGYMAAVTMDESRAAKLIELVGNHEIAVAVENHSTQTVLSGTRTLMDTAAEISCLLKVSFSRLNSPYPFHSPLMNPVVPKFAARLKRHPARKLKTPVYSAIMGRYYNEQDNLLECLAEHLILPVRFARAMRRLHQDGAGTFVECGALETLTKLTRKTLDEADIATVPCLVRDMSAAGSMRHAAMLLNGATATAAELLLPDVEKTGFDAFWRERSARVTAFARSEFQAFQGKIMAVATQPAERLPQPMGATIQALPPQAAPVVTGEAAGAPQVVPAAPALSRAQLFDELIATYASALEYPREVFSESVELEAELGVDSVKQTELFARVAETYGLPPSPPDFRLGDYQTLGKIADFVHSAMPVQGSRTTRAPESRSPEPEVRQSPAEPVEPISRGSLASELVRLYATSLEYPEEVFSDSVHLEADLGIDSVKQTELMARTAERYRLPPAPAEFRMSNYQTMGQVVDYVLSAIHAAA
jgi:acyl transferase domain-containing protein